MSEDNHTAALRMLSEKDRRIAALEKSLGAAREALTEETARRLVLKEGFDFDGMHKGNADSSDLGACCQKWWLAKARAALAGLEKKDGGE